MEEPTASTADEGRGKRLAEHDRPVFPFFNEVRLNPHRDGTAVVIHYTHCGSRKVGYSPPPSAITGSNTTGSSVTSLSVVEQAATFLLHC
jgi:hypothetical protein